MAFQTSCAAVGGLNCLQDVVADDEGRELVQHGSALFPIACYEEDLKSYSVAWHWHEEFEYILAVKGPLAVDVSKARLVLQTGQGVFVNSGVFHAVEQAETGDALLHSGVFHPRLIGGMDTIFGASAGNAVRGWKNKGLSAGADRGPAHETDAAFCGRALC